MNHPSEWARFFDKNTGRYRYKHKGSGVVRDTFMNIGKVFKNNENNVAKKTAQKPQKQSLKRRVRELKKVRNKYEKYFKSEKKRKPLSEDSKKKLANILTKHKKKSDALVKLNRILTKY